MQLSVEVEPRGWSPFDAMPEELLVSVLIRVPRSSLSAARLACTSWKAALDSPHFQLAQRLLGRVREWIFLVGTPRDAEYRTGLGEWQLHYKQGLCKFQPLDLIAFDPVASRCYHVAKIPDYVLARDAYVSRRGFFKTHFRLLPSGDEIVFLVPLTGRVWMYNLVTDSWRLSVESQNLSSWRWRHEREPAVTCKAGGKLYVDGAVSWFHSDQQRKPPRQSLSPDSEHSSYMVGSDPWDEIDCQETPDECGVPAQLHVYDPATDTWQRMLTSQDRSRDHEGFRAAVTIKKKIYLARENVLWVNEAANAPSLEVDVFDPSIESWSRLPLGHPLGRFMYHIRDRGESPVEVNGTLFALTSEVQDKDKARLLAYDIESEAVESVSLHWLDEEKGCGYWSSPTHSIAAAQGELFLLGNSRLRSPMDSVPKVKRDWMAYKPGPRGTASLNDGRSTLPHARSGSLRSVSMQGEEVLPWDFVWACAAVVLDLAHEYPFLSRAKCGG